MFCSKLAVPSFELMARCADLKEILVLQAHKGFREFKAFRGHKALPGHKAPRVILDLLVVLAKQELLVRREPLVHRDLRAIPDLPEQLVQPELLEKLVHRGLLEHRDLKGFKVRKEKPALKDRRVFREYKDLLASPAWSAFRLLTQSFLPLGSGFRPA